MFIIFEIAFMRKCYTLGQLLKRNVIFLSYSLKCEQGVLFWGFFLIEPHYMLISNGSSVCSDVIFLKK